MPLPSETADLVSAAIAGLRIAASQSKALSPLDSLRLCFAKAKITPTWDTLCKAFILCNLVDVDSATALALLFSETSHQVTTETIKDLLRYSVSYKHTKDEYTQMFATILDEKYCQVRGHVVMQSVKQRESLKESRKHQAILSGSAFRKPSLTQILEAKLLSEGCSHPQDSFNSFCRTSKIASNVNLRIKQVAYFLLCLPEHPDKGMALAKTVGGDNIILKCIESMKIMQPDVEQLRRIIMDTHYTIAPTETLRDFKEKCISSCLVTSGKRSINWTMVMRLYLAAYSRQDISKDLWCYVLQHEATQQQQQGYVRASAETETMVLSFVKSYPMALLEVIDVMLDLTV